MTVEVVNTGGEIVA